MPRLLTIGYPEVSGETAEFIRSFRRKHDPRQQVVEAHFTMVFGCAEINLDAYTNHVAAITSTSKGISFSCRYAMLGADDEDETAYVFLVPDTGYAAISLLHDRLYTGPLASHLRLDLPYVPHITVAALGSGSEAKSLCDELNKNGVLIEGNLRALTVGTVEAGKFKNLSRHALGEA